MINQEGKTSLITPYDSVVRAFTGYFDCAVKDPIIRYYVNDMEVDEVEYYSTQFNELIYFKGSPLINVKIKVIKNGKVVSYITTNNYGSFVSNLNPGYYDLQFKFNNKSITMRNHLIKGGLINKQIITTATIKKRIGSTIQLNGTNYNVIKFKLTEITKPHLRKIKFMITNINNQVVAYVNDIIDELTFSLKPGQYYVTLGNKTTLINFNGDVDFLFLLYDNSNLFNLNANSITWKQKKGGLINA